MSTTKVMPKESAYYTKTTTTRLQLTGVINTDTGTITIENEEKLVMQLAKEYNGKFVTVSIQVKEDEKLPLYEDAETNGDEEDGEAVDPEEPVEPEEENTEAQEAVKISNLKKLHNENKQQYLWRIDNDIRAKKYDNWAAVTPIVNKELHDDEAEYFGESAYRKPVAYAREFYEAGVFDKYINDEYLKELQVQKRELEKERKKFQAEKLEYNKWLREDARDELIVEKIVDAINQQSEISIPDKLPTPDNEKAGLLLFGDEHFGTDYEIRGLMNEIINSYSPEIFYDRMADLLDQVIKIVKKEGLTVLNIFSMGDFTDGILRCSQLMHLRYGVVEGTVMYSNYITEWLNKLSKEVSIKFQVTFGNHSELRMLSQPKGTFQNENMSLVVSNTLNTRLKDNPNFEYVENPTGMMFANICGYNVLGIHGEVKSMERAIKDFSTIYNIKIDYLVAGHLHHSKTEEVGFDSEVINVPSIIGIDNYSLSLRKTANAGATLLIFEVGKAKQITYSIKLN